jgi:hypothetical protein
MQKILPKKTTKIPNGQNIFPLAIKYTSIFLSRALQNLPELGFFV